MATTPAEQLTVFQQQQQQRGSDLSSASSPDGSGSNGGGSMRKKRPTFAARMTARMSRRLSLGAGPAIKCNVAFKDVTCTGPGGRAIISGVTGSCKHGQLVAVMGGSGCGKSTLLNALAQRSSLKVRGEVMWNGSQITTAQVRQLVSYVQQDVALIGDLTVRETLWMAARLEHGYFAKMDSIKKKVDTTIKAMGLVSCADAPRVGSLVFKGLSGGQKRRLAVAVELISNPSVLFLDEPTTGLDSTAAVGIIQELRSLAKLGTAVMFVIHQPPSHVWKLFDNVLLLTAGRPMYFGPAATAVDYFQSMGFVCPVNNNPADFLVELVDKNFSSAKDLENIAASYQNDLKDRVVIPLFDDAAKEKKLDFAKKSEFASSEGYERAITLLHRNVMLLSKNVGLVILPMIFYVCVATFLGLIYLRVGDKNDSKSVRTRISILSGGTSFFSMLSVIVIPFLDNDKRTFYREYRNGLYGVLPFVFSFVVIMIPVTFVLAVLSGVLYVYMTGLRNPGEFIVVLWPVILVSQLMVYTFAAFFDQAITAIAAAAAFLAMSICVSGFFINFDEMSWIVRWIGYLDHMKYGFRAHMRNEFENVPSFNSTLFPDGNSVLAFYTFDTDNVSFWGDVGILFGLCVGWAGLLCWFLLHGARHSKLGR